ncbi:MAG: ascorbate-dependent monooxygenase [Isosphaeraceae bacterium]|nr:ascorbate-dependent monooxygenase [Isosphaeraceae bacterium]
MRRMTFLAAGLTACLTATAGYASVPTYHKDVTSILQRRCQDCHRPGQVAPFPLLTYDQARKRAADIARVIDDQAMPPWPASAGYGGPFRDERKLTRDEIAILTRWAEGGTPEGDAADGPPPREFTTDWPLGKPDLVLTMPEPYKLDPTGNDEFRVFVLPTDLPEDKWVRAVDFQPGNRRVVHHILATFDVSGRARAKDTADPGPGYTAVGGFGDGVPIRGFLPIWTPGSRPGQAPEGAGYLLAKKADVLIQLHYHKSGKHETDATSVGLYFSDRPLSKQVQTGFVFPNVSMAQAMKAQDKVAQAKKGGRRPNLDELMSDVLVIPAGEANYEIKASTKNGGVMSRPLNRDILLTAVMPHMHWLGKNFTFTAVLPDETQTRIPLIRIDRWNFNWQGTYALAEPIRLPKGAWFEMEAHFDNSAANPANPSKPPRLVHWGEETNDEMCIGVYEFVNADGASSPPKDGRTKAAGE